MASETGKKKEKRADELSLFGEPPPPLQRHDEGPLPYIGERGGMGEKRGKRVLYDPKLRAEVERQEADRKAVEIFPSDSRNYKEAAARIAALHKGKHPALSSVKPSSSLPPAQRTGRPWYANLPGPRPLKKH